MRGDNGDQDVLHAPVAQIVHHREPELGPLVVGDPQPQNLAFAFRSDAQGHVNGLVFNLTTFCVADFDLDSVKQHDRLHRF